MKEKIDNFNEIFIYTIIDIARKILDKKCERTFDLINNK